MEIDSPDQLINPCPALNWHKAKFIKFQHTLVIANFMSLESNFESYIFSADYSDKVKWCLRLYPGTDPEYRKFLSIFFFALLSDGAEVKASFELKFLDSNGSDYGVVESIGIKNFIKNKCLACKDIISRKELSDNANLLLPNGKLILLCEMMIDCNSLRIANQLMDQSNAYNFKLSTQFGNLFDSGMFSDLTIEVEENEIKVHKAILAARSPVFEDIFNDEKKQIIGNRMTVTDVNYETLKEIMHFIYTEKVSSKENLTKDLLYAAQKYALPNLQLICETAQEAQQ